MISPHCHSDREHHRRVSIAQEKMKLKEWIAQKAKDRKTQEIIQEILRDDSNDTVNESNEEVTDTQSKKMHSKRDTRELNSE